MPPDDTAGASATQHLSDAEFAITSFSSWIVSADTKAGLLSAGTALLVGALVGERGNLVTAAHGEGAVDFAVLWLIALTAAALLTTAGSLAAVLYPRKSPTPTSRFVWPHLVNSPRDMSRFVGQVHDDAAIALEAWNQARALASIAHTKFKVFKTALIAFAVSATAFIALAGVSAFLPAR